MMPHTLLWSEAQLNLLPTGVPEDVKKHFALPLADYNHAWLGAVKFLAILFTICAGTPQVPPEPPPRPERGNHAGRDARESRVTRAAARALQPRPALVPPLQPRTAEGL